MQLVQAVPAPVDQKKDKNAKGTKNVKNEPVQGSQGGSQFGQEAYWPQGALQAPDINYKAKGIPATQPPVKETKKIQGYVPDIAIMVPKETKKSNKQATKKSSTNPAASNHYGPQDSDSLTKGDYWNELSAKDENQYSHTDKNYDEYSSKRGTNPKSKHTADDQRTVSGKMKFDDKYSNYESSKGYPKTGESDHHTEHAYSEHSANGTYQKAALPDAAYKSQLPPAMFYPMQPHPQHSYYGKDPLAMGPGSKKGKHPEEQNPYLHGKYGAPLGKPDRMDASNYSINQQTFYGPYNYSQGLDFIPPQPIPGNPRNKNLPSPYVDPRSEIFGRPRSPDSNTGKDKQRLNEIIEYSTKPTGSSKKLVTTQPPFTASAATYNYNTEYEAEPFRPDGAGNSRSSKESGYNRKLELEKLIREREQVAEFEAGAEDPDREGGGGSGGEDEARGRAEPVRELLREPEPGRATARRPLRPLQQDLQPEQPDPLAPAGAGAAQRDPLLREDDPGHQRAGEAAAGLADPQDRRDRERGLPALHGTLG